FTTRSALAVFPDERVDQAHPVPGRTLVPSGTRLGRPDHARDVAMRPFDPILDETLEILRGGDGAGPARTDIAHVGNGAVDQLVVGWRERKAPQLVSAVPARSQQLLAKCIVIGEYPTMLMPERNHHRTRQCR